MKLGYIDETRKHFQFNSIQFIKIYKFAPCKVNYIIYYKNDYKLNMLTPNKMIYYNIVKNYKNFDIIIEIYIYTYIYIDTYIYKCILQVY